MVMDEGGVHVVEGVGVGRAEDEVMDLLPHQL